MKMTYAYVLLGSLVVLSALSGCALFTPTSDIHMDTSMLEGHAPPGSHFVVIEGQPGSCMPKRIAAGGGQDLKGATATITCVNAQGVTETATFAIDDVNGSNGQAIVAGTTNKALDTVNQAIGLAKTALAATPQGAAATLLTKPPAP